jgi:hypothetical protein
MNKEASYLRSHLAILHQKKNNPIHLLLCDGGKTHFIAWAKSGDIWPKQQTSQFSLESQYGHSTILGGRAVIVFRESWTLSFTFRITDLA